MELQTEYTPEQVKEKLLNETSRYSIFIPDLRLFRKSKKFKGNIQDDKFILASIANFGNLLPVLVSGKYEWSDARKKTILKIKLFPHPIHLISFAILLLLVVYILSRSLMYTSFTTSALIFVGMLLLSGLSFLEEIRLTKKFLRTTLATTDYIDWG